MAIALVASMSCHPSTSDQAIATRASTPSPKSVVLIFIDDPVFTSMKLYSGIHLYGRNIDGTIDTEATDPETSKYYANLPTMDRLASEGVWFEEFRTMPVCSSSRACILTGMYAFERHGMSAVIRGNFGWDEFLEFNSEQGFGYPVIADKLQGSGIDSSMIGKWHLALRSGADSHPASGQQGTGEEHIPRVGKWNDYITTFQNLTPEGMDYYDYTLNNNGYFETVVNNSTTSAPSNRENLDRTGYLTRTQAIDIVTAVNSHTPGQEFFVYGALNTTHSPFQPPPVDMVNSPEFQVQDEEWASSDHLFKDVQGMMESIDFSIQYILDNIDPEILANTVFIIAGDNGIAYQALSIVEGESTNPSGLPMTMGDSYRYLIGKMEYELPPGASPALGPKKQGGRVKLTCYELGIRSPLIIWDPSGEVIKNPGRKSLAMVDIVDIPVTIMDLMGVDFDASSLDGVSLLPVLDGTVSRKNHSRQHSFSEVYAPLGTGPLANPRHSPSFRGEWSPMLGNNILVGDIFTHTSNLVRFYRALEENPGPPTLSNLHWQVLGFRQRSYIRDVSGTANPGTYKILRNDFEDDSEYVDHFFKLYDEHFVAVDPIEAYELQDDPEYAEEYSIVSGAFNQFLSAAPPSAPIY